MNVKWKLLNKCYSDMMVVFRIQILSGKFKNEKLALFNYFSAEEKMKKNLDKLVQYHIKERLEKEKNE